MLRKMVTSTGSEFEEMSFTTIGVAKGAFSNIFVL